MLTQRDKEILSWIEKYKAISVPQCTEILFNKNYEGCRRRLKQLEDMELLKSYISKLTKEKIYYIDKKLKDHDLLRYDFLKEVCKHDGKIRNIILEPRYLNGLIRPDAFIEFEYKNNLCFVLLEVDYTHYTSNIKMQMYEKLYKSNELQSQCYGKFPIVIISRPSLNDIRYNSSNFNVLYTDLRYNLLNNLLF